MTTGSVQLVFQRITSVAELAEQVAEIRMIDGFARFIRDQVQGMDGVSYVELG